jgi:lipoprotein-releasing system permease protein
MSVNRHLNILDYTLQAFLRRKFKNATVVLVFTFVIFIVASVIFLTYSFKREALLILEGAPELIIQKMTAGRHELIPTSIGAKIADIPGVAGVEPRYWGYYYDSYLKANYTVLAASREMPTGSRLLRGTLPLRAADHGVAIGAGVARTRFADIDSYISLQSAGGEPMEFKVAAVFENDSELLTSDLIVMGPADFSRLFDMPPGSATDLIVHVYNENEAPVVARKIRERFPDTRPILRNEIVRTYDAVFGWRSGLIMTLFAAALAAFIILAWDKATGLSADERKEIGVLKALGWETSDVLEMKFWEGFVISLTSFLGGILLAYCHVYFFGATLFGPALKGWSVIYPEFRLVPFIEPYQIATLMAVTVIPYIASTIIPSWKASITDPDEIVRG